MTSPFKKTQLLNVDQIHFMPSEDTDLQSRAERLAGAIKIPTITYNPREIVDTQAFLDINAYIENEFPELHKADFVQFVQVNEYSRLYR